MISKSFNNKSFEEPIPDLSGMSILVTGGTGSFGQAFIETILKKQKPHRLVVFSRDEFKQSQMAERYSKEDTNCLRFFIGDVRDSARLEMAMLDVDIVIHAAALKHVPIAEYNPIECINTNVVGAENVIQAAIRNKVSKVMALSTDKAVNPTSVMGTTKLLAEKIFVNAPERSSKDSKNKTKFTVVRFGNVFGSAGSVVETFHKQIYSGKKITLTNEDISRYFMSIKTACDLVLDCINLSKGERETPIFILKMKKLKIKDIAERMNVALNKKAKLQYQIIGLNRGEKFSESLYTDFESQFIKEDGDYLIVTKSRQPNKLAVLEKFMSKNEVDTLIKEWLKHGNEV